MDIESRLNEIFERIKGKDIAPLAVFQGMRGIVNDLTKEQDELRAYKEAAEKQEPVQWVCELSSNPWPNGGGTRRDTKEEALNYINSESNHCKYDTVSPIYRLPVPADKPASSQEKADLIMEFVDQIAAAYESGFTPYPHMTLQQLHRVAQHHVKDEFGIETDDFQKIFGADLFERCRAISQSWDKPAVAVPYDREFLLQALDKIIRWHQSVSDLPQCIDDDVSQGYCVSYEKLEELENLIPQSAYDFDPEESPSHRQQRCSIGQPTSHDVEPQVTIEHNGKCFGVDESISEFVTLLNSVGLETVASCSGHGHRPANIALKDGREIIIARDYEEARKIDRIFPVDINGDTLQIHENNHQSKSYSLSTSHEPVWDMFGLTYASWLVWPRVIMQAMDLDWQRKFVALAVELNERFPDWEPEGSFHVGLRVNGKMQKLPDHLCNYRHPIDKYRRPPIDRCPSHESEAQ